MGLPRVINDMYFIIFCISYQTLQTGNIYKSLSRQPLGRAACKSGRNHIRPEGLRLMPANPRLMKKREPRSARKDKRSLSLP